LGISAPDCHAPNEIWQFDEMAASTGRFWKLNNPATTKQHKTNPSLVLIGLTPVIENLITEVDEMVLL
jgi:hypothetical protein